jgi:hypothetical protein
MGALLRGARLPEQFFPLRGKWLRRFLATAALLLLAWAGDGARSVVALVGGSLRELWLPSGPDWVAAGWSALVALIAGAPIATAGLWRLWRILGCGGPSAGIPGNFAATPMESLRRYEEGAQHL